VTKTSDPPANKIVRKPRTKENISLGHAPGEASYIVALPFRQDEMVKPTGPSALTVRDSDFLFFLNLRDSDLSNNDSSKYAISPRKIVTWVLLRKQNGGGSHGVPRVQPIPQHTLSLSNRKLF
jgi:hypothetical protein